MAPHVDVTWTRFVEETDPDARYVVDISDIDRLGLRPAYEAFIAPEPEPPAPVKELPAPPNKAAPRPSTK